MERKINKTEAKNLLLEIRAEGKGKLLSLEFVKRTTNELRKMVCRFGVKKFVKGVGLKFDPKHLHLMVVYDVRKRDYRMISLERVRQVKFRGVIYKVA